MDKAAWLAQIEEEILQPDRPICDPHHHLWDHPGSRYLLDELLSDTNSGHNIVSTVFVECSSMYRQAARPEFAPVGETEFVNGIAAMSASGNYGSTRVANGIVGFADLSLGKRVKPVLEAHLDAAKDRFCGIRHATGWFDGPEVRNSHTNPTEGLLSSDQFLEGFSVLDAMGMTFDAWLYHYQIPEFVELAKNFPNTTIILDHFGGPLGIPPFNPDETFVVWQENISALQYCENVVFKLGGINMKINGYSWHKREMPPTSDQLAETTRRYYDHCIDLFGAERCMFESNFPVDKESCSYAVLWNAFKKITAGRSEAEKSALFHDTAVKTYGLQE